MTAKQAIKARCRDYKAGARACEFTDCALKGLARSKGRVKTRVIKDYCRWCLNGHLFSACNSSDCAIYQFRNGKRVAIKSPEFAYKHGVQRGFVVTQTKSREIIRQGH